MVYSCFIPIYKCPFGSMVHFRHTKLAQQVCYIYWCPIINTTIFSPLWGAWRSTRPQLRHPSIAILGLATWHIIWPPKWPKETAKFSQGPQSPNSRSGTRIYRIIQYTYPTQPYPTLPNPTLPLGILLPILPILPIHLYTYTFTYTFTYTYTYTYTILYLYLYIYIYKYHVHEIWSRHKPSEYYRSIASRQVALQGGMPQASAGWSGTQLYPIVDKRII